MIRIQQIIDTITKDDLYLARKKQQWNTEDELTIKYKNQSFPHSNGYEVSIPSFFLYELKDIEYLNYFPIIIARDGALSLAKFFYTNPQPKHIQTTFFIHARLASLVPKEWLSQVFFYETVSKNCHRQEQNKIKNIYLSLLGNKYFANDNYLKSISQLITRNAKDNPIHLTFIATNNHSIGGKQPNTKLNKYIYYAIDNIKSSLPLNTIFSYKNIMDLDHLNLEDAYFYDTNQYNFLFSDCFVAHSIMSKGAKKMSPTLTLDKSFYYPISFFHGYLFSEQCPESYNDQRKKYTDNLKSLSPYLIENENNLQRNAIDDDTLLIATKAFESLIYNHFENC